MGKSINKAFVLGNLGDDPKVRYTGSGVPVANVSVATSERFKRNGVWEETTDWHNLVFWGELAKIAEKYLKKGSKVHVEGRMQKRSYPDPETGATRDRQEIVVTELTMVGGPRSAEQKEEAAYAAAYSGGAQVVTNPDSEPHPSEMPNF